MEWIKGNNTYNLHLFNLTQDLRIINKRADTFSFPLSLAAIKDWSSCHSPLANCELRSCLPSCPSWVSDLCICSQVLKAVPFYQTSFPPADSVKLLKAWKQLSHYPNWTWTRNFRRFTHHWAASLPGLPAAAILWSQHSIAHRGHHILFFNQAWYHQVLLKWLNINTFPPK